MPVPTLALGLVISHFSTPSICNVLVPSRSLYDAFFNAESACEPHPASERFGINIEMAVFHLWIRGGWIMCTRGLAIGAKTQALFVRAFGCAHLAPLPDTL